MKQYVNQEFLSIQAWSAGGGFFHRGLLILLFLLSAWPAAARIQVEEAMRQLQDRYHFIQVMAGNTNGYVQWPSCGCLPAPHYPKNDYYGDLDEDKLLAVELVKSLFAAFDGAYSGFVRSTDGIEHIDGCDPDTVRNYLEADFPNRDVIVTEQNYPDRFDLINGYIKMLKCYAVPFGQAGIDKDVSLPQEYQGGGIMFLKGDLSDGPEEARIEEAQGILDSYWDDQGWMVATSYHPVICSYNATYFWPPDDGEVDVGLEAVRGRVYADFTGLQDWKGSGLVYIRTWTNEYQIPSVANSAPCAVDSLLHQYEIAPLGTFYWSSAFCDGKPDWDEPIMEEDMDIYDSYGWQLGQYAVARIDFDPPIDPVECGGCANCAPGTVETELNSAFMRVGLGQDVDGKSSGYLYFHVREGGAALYQRSSLQFISRGNAWASWDDSGHGPLNHVNAPQCEVMLSDLVGGNGYIIEVYHAGGTSPFKTITVEKLDDDPNKVKITQSEGSPEIVIFEYDSGTKTWKRILKNGNVELRQDTLAQTQNGAERTETSQVKGKVNGNWVLQYQEATIYTRYTNGVNAWEVPTRKEVGTVNPLVSTWTYYTTPGDAGYGQVREFNGPHGEWTRYEYNASGQVTTERSAWLDNGPTDTDTLCRKRVYTYGNPMVITDYVAGQWAAKQTIETTSEVLEMDGITYDKVVEKTYATETDPAPLVTTSWRYPYDYGNTSLRGQTRKTQNADGTETIFDYYAYPTISTTWSGEPGGLYYLLGGILNGIQTVTVRDALGRVSSVTESAIVNGALGITYSETINNNFDDFGRPTQTTSLGGRVVYRNYGCCDLESETDAEGVQTSYGYDGAGRQYLVTRPLANGSTITTGTEHDAMGRVVKVWRKPSTGTQMDLQITAYDTAGRPIAQTNALNGVTQYQDTVDSGTHKRTQTTTQVGFGESVQTCFRDGQLQNVGGSAAFATCYQYGADAQGTWSKEIKGTVNGTEWTQTYQDGLGRTYKTVYADGTPSVETDNPFSQSWYNSKGQLWKQVDPDGIISLYFYNAKGELETTAVDSDGAVGLSAGDRVTRTESDIYQLVSGDLWYDDLNSTYPYVHRTRIWQTNDANQAVLVSERWSSVDSLRTASMAFGLTNQTITDYPSPGQRRQTAIAPDGNTTVSLYINSHLQSVTNSATGTGVTYTYDAHGRANIITDARNGDTTYTFNNADQVATVTTPSPAQVTTSYYNKMLQATNVVQPDGTSVKTEFYPTGLRKKTYGSRTYPVEYTYDAQGRMATMKTWQNYSGNSGTATTTWNYDGYRGFLTNKIYQGNVKGPAYTYTAAGRLKTRVWARGITTSYAYNGAGDLYSTSYSDSTPGVTNGYDRRGRQTTNTQGSIATTRAYNDAGVLLTESYSGGPLNGLSITNGYDHFLRRTNLSILNSPSTILASTAYAYDAASRLQTVSALDVGLGTLNSATYTYLANSPLVDNIAFKNGSTTRMTTTKTYDYLNRLTGISSQPIGSSAIGYQYAYNNANQRTSVTNAESAYWVYQYDSLGQVISGKRYWSDGTPVAGQQFEYAFDDIGNRKTTASGGDTNGANLRSATYTANSLNQYTQRTVPGYVDITGSATNTATVTLWTRDAGGTPGGAGDPQGFFRTSRKDDYFRGEVSMNNSTGAVWLLITNLAVLNNGTNEDIVATNKGNLLLAKTPESFVYDTDGNMTSDGLWTNTWNAENRLIASESRSTVPTVAKMKEEWSYMPDGRWNQRIVSTNNGSTWVVVLTNRFVWDGMVLLAILDQTNGVDMSFLRGLDLSGTMQGAGGVGGLLAINFKNNGTHFAAYDGNGNVSALVNAADGTVSGNYEYDPFGQALRITGAVGKLNPIRFSTQYADDVTGDLKYLHRDYRPDLGRWKSRDPIDELGGLNLYGYCRNDSCNHWDIDGRFTYSIHDFITFWAAYEAGYSHKCAKKIAHASANTDLWHAFDHPYHFTRPVWGDPETYRQQAERNMNDLRDEAEKHALKGHCFRALKDLGRSLHVQEDYYSHVIGGKPASWDPSGNYERDGVVDHPNHRDNVDDHDYARAEVARQAVMGTLSSLLRSFSCCCSK